MTPKEFSEWYADWCRVFPDTAAFVNRSDDPKATLRHWAEVLVDARLEHAKAATQAILDGSEPEIPPFREYLIPQRVAGVCQKLADRQRLAGLPSSEPVYQRSVRTRPGEWDSRRVCAQLVECAARGGDVEALAKELMPVDREGEPRFFCQVCRDRGLVRVWHPHSMHAAARKQLKPGRGCYSAAVRCACRAGERYVGLGNGRRLPDGSYERQDRPIVFCEQTTPVCRGYQQQDVDALEDFMAAYRPANYVRAFDEWNGA